MRRWSLLIVGLLAGMTGAAKGQAHGRDRIALDEIQSLPAARNALEVIQSLRPHFLIARPSGSLRNPTPVPIKVYVDGVPRGTTAILVQIPATLLTEISYLRGSDATTRFGINHESGVILVKTSTPAPPDSPLEE
ncbi:MAG: hypothetical protein H6R40_877 [Gemmatimonadetes bacterium]|nr:hypothetical protein [Gemmatimonadota bacterium]